MSGSAASGDPALAASRRRKRSTQVAPDGNRDEPASGDGKKLAKKPRAAASAGSRGSPAARPGERKAALKITVCKCRACDCISSQHSWHATKTMRTQNGPIEVPEGDKCKVHGEVFEKVFEPIMPWETMCELVKSSDKFATVVDEAIQKLKNPEGPPGFKHTTVASTQACFVELRQTCQAVSHDELRKALGVTKLPANMKSVPKVLLPRSLSAKEDFEAFEEGTLETRYCFADPKAPRPTVSLITIVGASSKTDEMAQQCFDSQPSMLMKALARGSCDGTVHEVMGNRFKELLPLETFVAQRTRPKPKAEFAMHSSFRKGRRVLDRSPDASGLSEGAFEELAEDQLSDEETVDGCGEALPDGSGEGEGEDAEGELDEEEEEEDGEGRPTDGRSAGAASASEPAAGAKSAAPSKHSSPAPARLARGRSSATVGNHELSSPADSPRSKVVSEAGQSTASGADDALEGRP